MPPWCAFPRLKAPLLHDSGAERRCVMRDRHDTGYGWLIQLPDGSLREFATDAEAREAAEEAEEEPEE